MGSQIVTVLFGMLVITLVMIHAVSSEEFSMKVTFTRIRLYDDYVEDRDLLGSEATRSRAGCGVVCSSDVRCKAYFYNKLTRICITHDRISQAKTSANGRKEKGWQYFVDKGCATGWTLYHRHCYLFDRSQKVTWYDAERTCELLGSHMTELMSQGEHDFLVQSIYTGVEDEDHFWLGANDLEQEGLWKWIHSGQTMSFSVWWVGGYDSVLNVQISPQPDNFNSEEHCLEIMPRWNYEWNDEACTFLHYTTCEKENF